MAEPPSVTYFVQPVVPGSDPDLCQASAARSKLSTKFNDRTFGVSAAAIKRVDEQRR